MTSNDNVNVGLMRYSNDRNSLPNASDGGMVMTAMGPIETNRDVMNDADILVGSLAGSTPLTETLYEASLYFRGQPVFWGLNSDQCAPTRGLLAVIRSLPGRRTQPRSTTPRACPTSRYVIRPEPV